MLALGLGLAVRAVAATENQKVTASDGVTADQFGVSVSISQDVLVVGSVEAARSSFRGAV